MLNEYLILPTNLFNTHSVVSVHKQVSNLIFIATKDGVPPPINNITCIRVTRDNLLPFRVILLSNYWIFVTNTPERVTLNHGHDRKKNCVENSVRMHERLRFRIAMEIGAVRSWKDKLPFTLIDVSMWTINVIKYNFWDAIETLDTR